MRTYFSFHFRLPIADIFLKRRKRSPVERPTHPEIFNVTQTNAINPNSELEENNVLSAQSRSSGAIQYQQNDAIPSKLIVNKPRIELNTNTAISVSPLSSTEEDEYDYDYNYDYNYSGEDEKINYKDFSSLQDEQKYDKSQKEIAGSLPSSVYCDLVNTFDTKCFETSILEIWRYHEETIMSLTQEDIIYAINVVRKSPYFGFNYDFAGKLGGIVRNKTGHIIGAKSALHSWVSTVDEDDVVKSFISIDTEKVGKINLEWELDVIDICLEQAEEWKNDGIDMTVKVNVARSFNDISGQAIFGDLPKVLIGYGIMFVYTAVMIGRLNKVEQRFYLTGAG